MSEAPPSREAVTTSFTWRDSVDVKTLIISGMSAPAKVPQVMMQESFHHSVPSPRSLMRKYDATKVEIMDTIEVTHTSCVSGFSKFILSALPTLPFTIASLMRYEKAEATTITTRMAKIHTSSWT